MPAHLIIPAAQAAQFRVKTGPFSALDPIELKSGSFALPVKVLADAAHKDKKALLEAYGPPQNVFPSDCKWSERVTAVNEAVKR